MVTARRRRRSLRNQLAARELHVANISDPRAVVRIVHRRERSDHYFVLFSLYVEVSDISTPAELVQQLPVEYTTLISAICEVTPSEINLVFIL